MKWIKLTLITVITVAWCYLLSTRLIIGGSGVPPMGKFMSPYEGFWANAQSEAFPYPENVSIPGLEAPVKVYYDSIGVPHIFAENRHDMFMAQGYIVAQYRLWQMEFQTHAAAGRVSEIIGGGAINFDKLQRRKGMVLGASKTLDVMSQSPETLEAMTAYKDGVNNYIESLSYADLPIEYKLLDYRPEPWHEIKTALILQYMIDNLTGYDEDLQNTNALEMLGPEMFNFLFPERMAGISPVIPTGSDNGWDFTPATPDTTRYMSAITEVTEHILPMPDPDNGSNNWAISGSRTASGVPILANDTHLGLNLPSLWIMLQLHAPDYNVYGFTFTGAPGITIGFNENNAWGFTNGPRDHKDWYKIEFKDDSREEYMYDGKWTPVQSKVETFLIRDGEPVQDVILSTHHGPVVYDKNFGDSNPRKNYALHWIGHDVSAVLKALIALNSSKNYDDYLAAIQNWDAPPQNVVFASKNGDIALWNQGRFPAKWPGQGKFLMDGSDPNNDWNVYIPKAHNPFQKNPERGYVSSANQHSVDSLYPYWTWDPTYEHYRNRLINRRLDTLENVTVRDFMAMQNSNQGLLPAEALPRLFGSLEKGKLKAEHAKFLEVMMDWDYQYEVEETAPVMFHMWWDAFYELLWDEFYTAGRPVPVPDEYFTTWFMDHHPDHPFTDVKSTGYRETLADVSLMALDSGMKEYNEWQSGQSGENPWGNYKDTMVKHLADQGGSLAPFSRYHIMVGGESGAINSTKPNHGPSQRLIVELTDPPQAWGIYPGGQSGNPGSPMYDNMIDMWRDGEYLKFLFMLNEEDGKEQIKLVQTLETN
ncbi:penicillin acylase family protein [Fulvivirga sedimenti]|uniref:Penicillin acylase family protein n=1 Tax=Fulvivirga sedimenti TaxID=2879465 RepID=A0A9X1HNH5_9BACT|nr:penicillin acylase family protein [Fulvivirga sedimenti]MCA6073439.1 penicillin acylase family protein [Fulvivirga sedimenti]